MTGSISKYRMRDGRVRFRVRVPVNGKQESLGLYDTEDEAQRTLVAWNDMNAGAPKGRTVAVHGKDWLDRRELDRERHRAAKKDRARWRKHIAAAPFADKPVRVVDSDDVRRWVRSLDHLSTQSARNCLYLLSAFFRDACEDGYAKVNPCRDVRVKPKPVADERWTYLETAEIDMVKACPDLFARTVFVLAIYSGMREGEIWGLRWRDVRFDKAQLDVCRSYSGPTKGGRVRHIPLLGEARAALKAWHKARPGLGRALVFPSPTGGVWHREYDAGWSSRWRAELGLERRVRFHDFRHTCASHLVMGTLDGRVWTLREVQEWLGHRSITTTERYAHLSPDSIVAKARGNTMATLNAGAEKSGPRKEAE